MFQTILTFLCSHILVSCAARRDCSIAQAISNRFHWAWPRPCYHRYNDTFSEAVRHSVTSMIKHKICQVSVQESVRIQDGMFTLDLQNMTTHQFVLERSSRFDWFGANARSHSWLAWRRSQGRDDWLARVDESLQAWHGDSLKFPWLERLHHVLSLAQTRVSQRFSMCANILLFYIIISSCAPSYVSNI